MAITTKTLVSATCDHCCVDIDNSTQFLRISDHGLTFHLSCFTMLTPDELLHHMGHDESVIHTTKADGTIKKEGVRLRDPRALRRDGSINPSRSTEIVEWPI